MASVWKREWERDDEGNIIPVTCTFEFARLVDLENNFGATITKSRFPIK